MRLFLFPLMWQYFGRPFGTCRPFFDNPTLERILPSKSSRIEPLNRKKRPLWILDDLQRWFLQTIPDRGMGTGESTLGV